MRTHDLPSDEGPAPVVAAGMSCLVVGDGALTIHCCEILLERDHRIAAIVTTNPDVAQWADRHATPCMSDFENVMQDEDLTVDYVFSIVNLRILPSVLIERARKGAINFHDGPLPRYAGVHATSWALINREPQHGVTWHAMTATIDAGDILAQKIFSLSGVETARVLNTQCLEAGIETFEALLKKLETGSPTPLVQTATERSYFGLYERPDAAALISWKDGAEEIDALVRGLNFAPSPNPLSSAKIKIGKEYIIALETTWSKSSKIAEPGRIISVKDNRWIVQCGAGEITLEKVSRLNGAAVDLDTLARDYDVRPGTCLPVATEDECSRISEVNRRACRNEEFWLGRLRELRPASLPTLRQSAIESPSIGLLDRDLNRTVPAAIFGPEPHDRRAQWIALLAVYLARLNDEPAFDLGLRVTEKAIVPGLFSPVVPLRIEMDPDGTAQDQAPAIAEGIGADVGRGSFASDIVARYPELGHLVGYDLAGELPIQVEFVETLNQAATDTEFALRIVIPANGERCRWKYDRNRISDREVHRVAAELDRLLVAAAAKSSTIAELPLLSTNEAHELLITWNATEADTGGYSTIHAAFEAQAARTPDATALVCGEDTVTFRELNERANQLARHLSEAGVEPETLVAIAVERSVEMVVGLFGILKAGGAYMPLDPAYPAERLAHMLDDSGAAFLLTKDAMLPRLPRSSARLILLDVDWPEISQHDTANLDGGAGPNDLAYVIYTSGSTGRPKGVMVEHRNVTNFFAGMDDTVDLDEDPVWLAVTSLSFDISVLEIFWTLARGAKVVVYTRDEFEWTPAPAATALDDRSIDFSLFYFSADQGEDPDRKYRLLLDGARFADTHGFRAVWTPERHFHEFGGLYPNPSVTGAALAVATKNIQIRSGSIVAPLHSPIRIAEEWSVVDNLSGGRVGLSFASGWMPEDFVIKPENFASRKAVMMETIDTVRRLWRGEAVAFPAATETSGPVEVRTQPRPIQADLPVWVTTAGNPETYEMAARAGANVLTHLLGQSLVEVGEKVRIYRDAWQAAGHPGRGCVSLMLHTFVSDTCDVRDIVREPLKAYLRTSASLIKQYSWAFPTFTRHADSDGEVNFADVSADELEEILDHAFERYYETSGLFGRVADCEEMIRNLKAHDIDDVACLIDFGIPTDRVLDALADLDRLRLATSAATDRAAAEPARGTTIAELIEHHGVTHFQCTPSMASLLFMDDATRSALAGLRTWLIGGEALPADLANAIATTIEGDVINMYGPTETTVWSTTHRVARTGATAAIGRPIANTKVYVVDRRLRPVPVGVPGELVIGGAGVVRGYLGQPDLTAERFLENPFVSGVAERIYRTGDLVRYRDDGTLEFIGRLDYQVKVRGHRIELGEIEACLRATPCVRDAVAMVREDMPGDKRIAAYVLTADGPAPTEHELRASLGKRLPAVMVPDHIVALDAFPLTPNRKIDRSRLPVPARADQDTAVTSFEAPASSAEKEIAELWKKFLGVEKIGRHDNFFELGGHSLSAVQVIMAIRAQYGVRFSFKTLMEQPDLAAIASELERLQDDVVSGEL